MSSGIVERGWEKGFKKKQLRPKEKSACKRVEKI
jgi:hypothetical protein